MPPLTNRQKEYLLLYALRNGRDRGITEAAEVFQVSKTSAFMVTSVLEEQGMIQKDVNGVIRLTESGWEAIRNELRYQRELARWLASDLGLIPMKADQAARHMAVYLEEEALEAILAHVRIGGTPRDSDWQAGIPDLELGTYVLPFLVCKRGSREVSMGDQGFQKPAELIKTEDGCVIGLRPKWIHYKPPYKKALQGCLARMWYQLGSTWYELEQDEEGRHLLPEQALCCETGPEGLVGVVRIRARASVGIAKMPESEADIVFFLEKRLRLLPHVPAEPIEQREQTLSE